MDVDLSQEERLNRLAQAAKDTLAQSANCAQATFTVLQQEFGFEEGSILKALTPFPGIALRGETCGAVVGCLMAIGSVFGRDRLDDYRGYLVSLRPARNFCRQFEVKHGSISCAELLEVKLGRNFDLADGGEAMAYLTAGGLQACGEIVASAVQIAADIIQKKK
jgi:C_GCAxxG_C_C family probable redox protein